MSYKNIYYHNYLEKKNALNLKNAIQVRQAGNIKKINSLIEQPINREHNKEVIQPSKKRKFYRNKSIEFKTRNFVGDVNGILGEKESKTPSKLKNKGGKNIKSEINKKERNKTEVFNVIEEIKKDKLKSEIKKEIKKEIKNEMKNEMKTLIEASNKTVISKVKSEISTVKSEISKVRNEISGVRAELAKGFDFLGSIFKANYQKYVQKD